MAPKTLITKTHPRLPKAALCDMRGGGGAAAVPLHVGSSGITGHFQWHSPLRVILGPSAFDGLERAVRRVDVPSQVAFRWKRDNRQPTKNKELNTENTLGERGGGG